MKKKMIFGIAAVIIVFLSVFAYFAVGRQRVEVTIISGEVTTETETISLSIHNLMIYSLTWGGEDTPILYRQENGDWEAVEYADTAYNLEEAWEVKGWHTYTVEFLLERQYGELTAGVYKLECQFSNFIFGKYAGCVTFEVE